MADPYETSAGIVKSPIYPLGEVHFRSFFRVRKKVTKNHFKRFHFENVVPKWTQKLPRGTPKGDPKSIKNRHWTPQVPPGTPKAPKMDQKVTPDPPRHQNITKIHPKLNQHLKKNATCKPQDCHKNACYLPLATCCLALH